MMKMMDVTNGSGRGEAERLPFTREEMLQAQLLIRPAGEAERIVSLFYSQDPAEGARALPDGHLLLLAALSDELAARVIAHRPTLREIARLVRTDAEGFIDSLRGDWGCGASLLS
jgi:hypothetical protein